MTNVLPDISGKWVSHNGAFSQDFTDSRGYQQSKLKATGGQRNSNLANLEQLYDFSPLLKSQETTHGVERLWNLGNLAYSAEFYLFENSSEVGRAAQAFASGSKKQVRAARKQAIVSLRAKWHSTTGEYWSYTYNGEPRGVDYAGWVELYDTEQSTMRKIDINEIWKYGEELDKRIHAAYEAWASAEERKPRDQRHGFLPYETYRAKVMYSAHQLRKQRLPVETLIAVHCRIDDFAEASEVLRSLPEGTQFEDFDWRRIELLYS